MLRKLGARTFVRLLAKVHPDGHIDVEIVTSSGYNELDNAVLQDLRSWRWDPAEVAGKPVYSEKTFKMNLQAE
jgi:TonB family protein